MITDEIFDVNIMWLLNLSGEGMFGKVYTAVNMDTGAYMAMKEVSVDNTMMTMIFAISSCLINHMHTNTVWNVDKLLTVIN